MVVGEEGVGKKSLIKAAFGEDSHSAAYPGQIEVTINTFASAPELGKRETGKWLHRDEVDVAVIVYDVSREDSFKKLAEWILYIRGKYMRKSEANPHGDDCLYYIVGNKADLTT